MSSSSPSGGRLFVEPLEARVAPTGLIGRANLISDKPADPNYLDYSTPPTPGHLGFVDASATYGITAPGVKALVLSGADAGGTPGDQVFIFNQQDGFSPRSIFLQANAGNMVAFFQDKNGDGQVQTNELVGLSLGKKTNLSVNGTVDGDIVTNLNQDGTLALGGINKAKFRIDGLNVTGNINGNILSSGNVTNVTISGTVQNVLAGTATNGVSYHLGGSTGPLTGTITGGAYKDGIIGAAINNLSVLALVPGGRIQAGDGGLGAVGGGVDTLQILGDTDAFTIQGGAGGVGSATLKGGIGGDVSNVIVRGVANAAVNHLITIQGGAGGDAPQFKGGTGGSVNGVFTGFDVANVGVPSADALGQDILARGGAGGNGLRGGNGGDVINSNFRGFIPDDGTGNIEIQVLGGHGGLNVIPGMGKGGNGGNVSQVFAQNIDTLPDALNSGILLQGGDAGTKKNGGNIDGVTLLGRGLTANAGNGGDGTSKGGAGGALTGVTINNLVNLFASSLSLNAGQGGNASTGSGGAGGSITNVRMADSDLLNLSINVGTRGDGGLGANGVGGAGGAVSDVILNDSNVSGAFAAAVVRGGTGGAGLTGGGAGGDISAFQLSGTGFSLVLTAGSGASLLDGGTGDGGAGGNLLSVSVSNFPDLSTVSPASPQLAGQAVFAAAGSGGSGTGNGGNGGVLQTVNIAAGGSITLVGGNGGNGGSGAAGLGGGSAGSGGANSLVGAVSLATGSGGLSGITPGDGGTIDGFVASAAGVITIRSGDGHAGGKGGDIINSGTSLNLLTNLPSAGGLDVRSGAGGAVGTVFGAGGDINNFHGYISEGGLSAFHSGDGGGGAGIRKVGAGGSISQVELAGLRDAGPGAAQTVTFDAGSAGVSDAAKKGAAGGSVNQVVLYNLEPGTVIHHVAGGDASSGSKTGGNGGSINNVYVGTVGDTVADIGVRSGLRFGYALTQAGGLFAGIGGTGSKTSGVNGSVTNIVALAISSIVAGKGSHPGLVEAVDKINLSGGTATRGNADGSYFNFAVANLVGSVLNPNAAGATTFKYDANGPIDGLIASRTIPTNLNFVPEAIVEPDPENPNVLALADTQSPNPLPVILSPVPAGILA